MENKYYILDLSTGWRSEPLDSLKELQEYVQNIDENPKVDDRTKSSLFFIKGQFLIRDEKGVVVEK